MKISLITLLSLITFSMIAMQSDRYDDTLLERSAHMATRYIHHSPSLYNYPSTPCSIYQYRDNNTFSFVEDFLEDEDDSSFFARYWHDIKNKNYVVRENAILLKLNDGHYTWADLMILGTTERKAIYNLLAASFLKYHTLCVSPDLKSFLKYATVKECIQS